MTTRLSVLWWKTSTTATYPKENWEKTDNASRSTRRVHLFLYGPRHFLHFALCIVGREDWIVDWIVGIAMSKSDSALAVKLLTVAALWGRGGGAERTCWIVLMSGSWAVPVDKAQCPCSVIDMYTVHWLLDNEGQTVTQQFQPTIPRNLDHRSNDQYLPNCHDLNRTVHWISVWQKQYIYIHGLLHEAKLNPAALKVLRLHDYMVVFF